MSAISLLLTVLDMPSAAQTEGQRVKTLQPPQLPPK